VLYFCIYLSFLFELTGSSTYPKVTCSKISTVTLVDQNVSEEAQGINGKTPAKRSAASPKPQGMHIGSLWPGQVICWHWRLTRRMMIIKRVLSCKREEWVNYFSEKHQSVNFFRQRPVFALLLKQCIHFFIMVLFTLPKLSICPLMGLWSFHALCST
jgi:hypothetical protein